MQSSGALVGGSCFSLSPSRSSITTSITITDPAPVLRVRVRAGANKRKNRRRDDYEEPLPEPDHYAVLAAPRGATQAQIKRAYRLLVLKHHPDVSNRSGPGPGPGPAHVFLSITAAYQVLSNEDTRAQYDMRTQFFRKTATEKSNPTMLPKGNYYKQPDPIRYYRWGAELRKRTRRYKQSTHNLYEEPVEHEETLHENKGTFAGVLSFAFLRFSWYKLGYLVSWLLGGRSGVVLMLFVRFASWLCGKNNRGSLVSVVLAFGVGVSLARFALLPQGAIIALLYMSMKLHNDLK